MKLRRKEFCPIHRSLSCCGRGRLCKDRRLGLGIRRIDDPHHPRGYRESTITRRDAQGLEPQDRRTKWQMRNLPQGIC